MQNLEREGDFSCMELYSSRKRNKLFSIFLIVVILLVVCISYIYITINPYDTFSKYHQWKAKEIDCTFVIDEFGSYKSNWLLFNDAEAFETNTNGVLVVNNKSYRFKIQALPHIRKISFGNRNFNDGSKFYNEDGWSIDGEISISLISALVNNNITIYINSVEGDIFPKEIKKLTLVHN